MKTEYAFPSENDEGKQYHWINKGMTLRDYFAAKAMQTVLADWDENPSYQSIAEISYRIADAMLMVKSGE